MTLTPADLIYICWSLAQQIRNDIYGARVHVQGDEGAERTLCGISTEGNKWNFMIHKNRDSVSCLRCKRILTKGVLAPADLARILAQPGYSNKE